jgi:hypothetical protein
MCRALPFVARALPSGGRNRGMSVLLDQPPRGNQLDGSKVTAAGGSHNRREAVRLTTGVGASHHQELVPLTTGSWCLSPQPNASACPD